MTLPEDGWRGAGNHSNRPAGHAAVLVVYLDIHPFFRYYKNHQKNSIQYIGIRFAVDKQMICRREKYRKLAKTLVFSPTTRFVDFSILLRLEVFRYLSKGGIHYLSDTCLLHRVRFFELYSSDGQTGKIQNLLHSSDAHVPR